jgi:hypothetical protein
MLVCPPAMADYLYGVTVGSGPSTSSLVQLDPITGSLISTIGDTGYKINGLTWDPVDQTLYATTSNNDNNFADGLLRIDLLSGLATEVGSGAGQYVNVVTSNSAGELYGWTEWSDDPVVWDKVAGTISVLGDADVSSWEQSLAFDKTSNTLYFVNGDGIIYTVNTTTGALTQVALVNDPNNLQTYGTNNHHGDFASNGNIYVISRTGTTNPRALYEINPLTGEIISVLPTLNNLHAIAFIYDIVFGPTAADTLASMQANASTMRGFFSLQASYVNPGLSYDCSLFNDKGLCFSMTARNTSVSGSGIDSTSGVATASYRVNQNIRVGGFVEQMTSSVRDGGIRLDNNSPDYGVFGVWQENENGEGLKLRAAYRYGNKDLDVTRQAVGTAEAGFGKTELTTQGVQFTGSYGFQVHDKVLLSPYAGVRYIKIKRDGYTEELSAAVTTPLTYDNLTQETTSALLGANVAVQITPQVTASGSVGIEHDAARKIGNYSATGVDNLESIKFNDDSKRTRAVASLGLGYRINQTQQVGAQVVYREEAYGDNSTTTGMLTYTAGF